MTAAETIRFYMIYNDEAINRICSERLGLSVYDIYFIDMLFLGRYLTSFRQAYPVVAEIPGLTPEKIESWLGFASAELGTLTSEIKKAHKVDESYAYRYSPLRQYPIVKQQYAGAVELVIRYRCLLIGELQATFTMVDGRQDFPNPLGASFQRVCGEIVRRGLTTASFTISAEEAYGTKQMSKRTPAGLLKTATTTCCCWNAKQCGPPPRPRRHLPIWRFSTRTSKNCPSLLCKSTSELPNTSKGCGHSTHTPRTKFCFQLLPRSKILPLGSASSKFWTTRFVRDCKRGRWPNISAKRPTRSFP